MRIDAFLTRNEENTNFRDTYYHTPKRWNTINMHEITIDEENWSNEIKFLAENETDVSNE